MNFPRYVISSKVASMDSDKKFLVTGGHDKVVKVIGKSIIIFEASSLAVSAQTLL